jgi:hypothetical protein
MPDETTAQPQSHLFTVRIVLDAASQSQSGWRGKVQHVPSGAWRHFHDWETLVAFLQAQVQELKADRPQR